ncbi:MAG: glycine cleavage system protein GcvH [Longimicrobiales bacterium]
MAEFPEGLLYSEEHEYLKVTDDSAVYMVGITDYAQGELGDIVYLELPSAGDSFGRMDIFGTIEAVKAVSDLFSPLTGEVVEVNAALQDDPSVVNSDPYGAGWMVKIRISDESELEGLMDAAAYQEHVGE